MVALDRTGAGNNLIRALRSARRTWWRRALLDALLFAVVAAAIGVVAMWLRTLTLTEADRLPMAGWPTLRLLGAAAAAGFLMGLGVAALRSPSLLEVARRVDARLGQSGRFSTTFEVLAAGGPTNVVTRALLSEVEERAGRLDVGPAGWMRRDRGLGRGAFFAVVIAVLLLVVPVPTRPAFLDQPRTPGVPGANLDPAADAKTLAGVAELLDLVAEQEDSEYLHALAASFTDLADRVRSNATPAAETNRAVQDLVEHLLTASHEVGGAFAKAVDEALAPPSVQGGAAPDQGGAAAQPSGDATPDVAASAAAPAGNEALADPSAAFYRSLQTLVDKFEEDPAGVGVRAQRSAQTDPSATSSLYGGVLEAETDPNAAAVERPAGVRSEGEAGGAPVGAAERSDESAGDAAGRGGADLGLGSDAFLDLAAQAGAVAALPRNEREEGNFVEMELVPEADPGAATAVPAPDPPAFVRADEAAFTSRGIGAEYAGAVSRYFTPNSVLTGDLP